LALDRGQPFRQLLHSALKILGAGGRRAGVEPLSGPLAAATADLRQTALRIKAGVEQIVELQVRLRSGLLIVTFG
jgi:hypothetical protein